MVAETRSGPAILALLAAFSAAVQPAVAQSTISLSPTYSSSLFLDAVTGPNCTGMTRDGGCTGSGWFVTPDADVYEDDVYERPTSQTFSGSVPVATEYLGYLDLVNARYGYDDQYMYFQLTMYSPYLYKNDGTVDTGVFGSGTYYGVQIGSNNADDGQLLLRTEVDKSRLVPSDDPDLPDDYPGDYSSATAQGWFDQNNTVSGPGTPGGPAGVGTPDEEDDIPDFDGYEFGIIETHGFLKSVDPKDYVLFSRAYVDGIGQAVVELAFDYATFNLYCAAAQLACGQTPTSVPYLVFETTRGHKDNQNYLWNDKYTSGEAGSPYGAGKLENLYELDNMRAGFDIPDDPQETVPEPATLALLASGLSMLGLSGRRRRKD